MIAYWACSCGAHFADNYRAISVTILLHGQACRGVVRIVKGLP